MSKKKWGLIPRARIHLRQTLKRNPTAVEFKKALSGTKKYKHITAEQISKAFMRGEEVCLSHNC
jgi:hypothetical protein